jgi:energy-converting hydrogenase B subunit L
MSLGRVFIEGLYVNLKRIVFGSECHTDLQLRHDVLTGNVKPTPKVDPVACIGCGGCANVCPTKSITMIPIEPVELVEGLVKTSVPQIDEIKCVHCYHCHDFCPVYALFGVAGTIHPNDIGNKCDKDIKRLLQNPSKISEDKIKYIAQFLTDNAIIKKNEEQLEKQSESETADSSKNNQE